MFGLQHYSRLFMIQEHIVLDHMSRSTSKKKKKKLGEGRDKCAQLINKCCGASHRGYESGDEDCI